MSNYWREKYMGENKVLIKLQSSHSYSDSYSLPESSFGIYREKISK